MRIWPWRPGWLLVVALLICIVTGPADQHEPSVLAQNSKPQATPDLLQHSTATDWQAGQTDAGYTITWAKDGELALTPQVIDLLPWQELAETPLPGILRDHALLAVHDSLYLIGGDSTTGIRSSVQRSVIGADGSLSPWQALPSLPEPRHMHSVVQAGNSLLVIGGLASNYSGEAASVIYQAMLSDNGDLSDWETLPAPVLPSQLEETGVIVVNGSLFVIGGITADSGLLKTVYRAALDVDGTPHSWEAEPALPVGLADHAVAAQGNCLFVVGGSSSTDVTNRVYSASVDATTGITAWNELVRSRLPIQRKGHTATVIGGYLVVIGGSNALPQNYGEKVYRAAINADCTLEPWEEWIEQTLPRAIVNHTAVATDGFFFVAGGNRFGYSEVYDIIYRAALVPERHSGNWQRSTMPAGLSGHAAAIGGDMLLVTGGRSNGNIQAQVYATDALTSGIPNEWRSMPALPRPLHEHVTVATGSRFWTIGGNDGKADQQTVYTADVQADGALHAWDTHGCGLPQPLSSLAGVVHDNAIYLSGGRYGYEEQAQIYRLQADTADTENCWQTIGSLPVPLAEHAMAVANGYLFVSGGVTGAGGQLLSKVYVAPLRADGLLGTWQELTSTPLPRGLRSHSMLAINDSLYLSGGMEVGLPWEHHEIYRASVQADGTLTAWQELRSTPLPQSLYNHVAIASDLSLAVIGGRHNEQDSAEVLVAPLYEATQQASFLGQFDLGSVQNLGTLTWHMRGAPEVAVEVRYRVADESGVYGLWSSAASDGNIPIYDRGRFVQYLLHTTNPTGGVFAFDDIRLSYGNVGDFVRVIDQDGANLAGAAVYLNGTSIGSTNQQGVLTPEHFLYSPSASDHLVVLSQVDQRDTVRGAHSSDQESSADWAYRTYLTNLAFSPNGDIAVINPQSGGQIIQVRRNSPLILFNLVISIEWDANEAYLEQIARAVQYAADYLFDVTDGQMAFERVAIYDNAAHWLDADIQISTKNIVRPHAYIGGITADDSAHVIRLGRHWDGRTGSNGDWDQPEGYRTLVHEFGHYALNLYDSYFYLIEEPGKLDTRPSACTSPSRLNEDKALWGNDKTNASIMDYQYHSSELAARGVPGMWGEHCEQTEQWRLNKNSDWETLRNAYSDTQTPPRWIIRTPMDADRGGVMAGPERFPAHLLPFPAVDVQNSDNNGLSFDLTVLNPRQSPHAGALVTLVAGTQRQPIDQGLTNKDGQIAIYGAQPGDTLRASSLDGALSYQISVLGSQPHTLIMSSTLNTAGMTRQIPADPREIAAAARQVTQNQATGAYFRLSPTSDGSDLYISLHGFEPYGTVNATISQAGTTIAATSLAYSSTSGTYEGTAALPLGQTGGTGTIQVMGVGATLRGVLLNSTFALHHIPGQQATDLYAVDGNLHIHLPPEASGEPAYATITPLGILPSVPPEDWHVVGSAYSAVLSGARTSADAPFVLAFRYDQYVIDDQHLDPASLQIYRWKPATFDAAQPGSWEPLQSSLLRDDRSVSTTTKHFGIYALMGTRLPETIYLPLVVR